MNRVTRRQRQRRKVVRSMWTDPYTHKNQMCEIASDHRIAFLWINCKGYFIYSDCDIAKDGVHSISVRLFTLWCHNCDFLRLWLLWMLCCLQKLQNFDVLNDSVYNPVNPCKMLAHKLPEICWCHLIFVGGSPNWLPLRLSLKYVWKFQCWIQDLCFGYWFYAIVTQSGYRTKILKSYTVIRECIDGSP